MCWLAEESTVPQAELHWVMVFVIHLSTFAYWVVLFFWEAFWIRIFFRPRLFILPPSPKPATPRCAAAQRGPWPPHFWGFYITHIDASRSVGLLWTSDQLVAEASTWQHTTLTTEKIRTPGGIRTHNLSRRETADPHLRIWLRWSQDRHNTTVWTGSRQGGKNQPLCWWW